MRKPPLINIATIKFAEERSILEKGIFRVRVHRKWPVDETIIAYMGIIKGANVYGEKFTRE